MVCSLTKIVSTYITYSNNKMVLKENKGREIDQEQQLLVQADFGVGSSTIPTGGLTRVLLFSVFTSLCGSFLSGSAIAYSAPAESAIISDLGLSTAEFALFGSMINIGGLLGSLVCGKITDHFGRRGTMGLSDILYLTGWSSIAFSKGAWSLDIGRFALGLAISLNAYVVPVYIAEVSPKNLRGGLGLLHQFIGSCGIAFIYIAGLITKWRILALIGIFPSLIRLLGLFFIPESPRWLVMIGCDKGFEGALQRLRGGTLDISQEAANIKDHVEEVESVSKTNFFDVLQMKYAYALTVNLGLVVLGSLGGTSGILYYALAICSSAGFSETVGTITMALIQFPALALGVFLMDNYGRRPILIFSTAGMFVGCLSLASSFFLKEHDLLRNFSPYLGLIGILTFSAAFPVGMGGIPSVILSEMFPLNVKGTAGSLAAVVSCLSDWTVSYKFNFMIDWSSSGTFFIFTSINICSLLFVAKLVPETKGKSLEEVQDLVNHDVH